ncbi:MAG: flavin reductase [Ferruginibacter sp.]|nr:flavin reductase [Ferruginibacter sp.]
MGKDNNELTTSSKLSSGKLNEFSSPGFKGNKRPWNRVNLPVYSISSKAGDNQNMHIITYASQISMQPKRFVCGIYNGTKTLENVTQHGEFILQLLSATQYRLIDLLGKKTGKLIDKISRLKKRNEIVEWNGYPILKNCLAVMQLKVISTFEGGDHKGFLCDVIAYKNLNEGNVLTLDVLRTHKLIRI